MSSDLSVKALYGTEKGKLCFIFGRGPSLKNAVKHFGGGKKHPHVITIAINKAIEEVPADYWFWMDLDAYQGSKDHPNAKNAIKCGVDKWASEYDPDVYLWERAGAPGVIGYKGRSTFAKHVFEDGKLAWNGVSAIGSSSLAWNLGAFRIVYVGCENKDTEGYIEKRVKADPSKDWRSIYSFTFARVSEALKNRAYWMHPKVMLADASHTGTEYGDLALPKTTIPKELEMVDGFYKALESGEINGDQKILNRGRILT
jgi:hypothetical protein